MVSRRRVKKKIAVDGDRTREPEGLAPEASAFDHFATTAEAWLFPRRFPFTNTPVQEGKPYRVDSGKIPKMAATQKSMQSTGIEPVNPRD
jgi:hypothetical protein